MKFLNVYCEKRKASVYISLDKIVLVKKEETGCSIEIEGLSDGKGAVEVSKPAEELIRMINGEDKTTIGFRTNR